MKGESNLYNGIKKYINLAIIISFLFGLFVRSFFYYIDINTSQITTDKDKEEKTIVEIVKEESNSIVGIKSVFPEGQLRASGIIFHREGYIITNAHTVKGANEVYVYIKDGVKRKALVKKVDDVKDLAIIKINQENLTTVTFGNSDKIEVGEVAIAIGNPLEEQLYGTVTVGVISALNRQLVIEGKPMELIQTDAAINNGNSGGALLNSKGEVIGMNTFHIPSNKAEGIGFAIPSNEVVKNIKKYMKDKNNIIK